MSRELTMAKSIKAPYPYITPVLAERTIVEWVLSISGLSRSSDDVVVGEGDRPFSR